MATEYPVSSEYPQGEVADLEKKNSKLGEPGEEITESTVQDASTTDPQ